MKFKKLDRVSVQPNEQQGISRKTYGVIDRVAEPDRNGYAKKNTLVRIRLDDGKGYMTFNVCYLTKE